MWLGYEEYFSTSSSTWESTSCLDISSISWQHYTDINSISISDWKLDVETWILIYEKKIEPVLVRHEMPRKKHHKKLMGKIEIRKKKNKK